MSPDRPIRSASTIRTILAYAFAVCGATSRALLLFRIRGIASRHHVAVFVVPERHIRADQTLRDERAVVGHAARGLQRQGSEGGDNTKHRGAYERHNGGDQQKTAQFEESSKWDVIVVKICLTN